MNKYAKLLDIIVSDMNREYLDNQKETICRNICSDVLHSTINPNEMDFRKTRIVKEDLQRYFVSVPLKNGVDMTVPVPKTRPYMKRLSRKLYR